MKKGQIVKCVMRKGPNLTKNKDYLVTSGEGDERHSFIGCTTPFVGNEYAMITDDDGDSIAIIIPECAYGKWEVVS